MDLSKVRYFYPVLNEKGEMVALCTTKPEAAKIAGPDDEIGVVPIGLLNTNLGVAKYTPPTPAVTTYGEYVGETDLRPQKARTRPSTAAQVIQQGSLADRLAADGYDPLDLDSSDAEFDEYYAGPPSTAFASGEFDVPPAWGSV
jgi:hypothetical protein